MFLQRLYPILYRIGLVAFGGGCVIGIVYSLQTSGRPPSISLTAPHVRYIQSLAERRDYESAAAQILVAQELTSSYQVVPGLEPAFYGAVAVELLEREEKHLADKHFGRLLEAIAHLPSIPHDDKVLVDALAVAAEKSTYWFEQQQNPRSMENQIKLLNDVAWIRATHPDASFRDGAQAVRLATNVNDMLRGQNVSVLDTLAAAQAEIGEWRRAANTLRKAVGRAEATSVPAAVVADMKKRLSLYEAQKPYRDPGMKSGKAD